MKVVLYSKVEPDLHEWLKKQAEKDRRTLSDYVRIVLENYRKSSEIGRKPIMLTKRQKKELFEKKIGPFVAKRIRFLKKAGELQYKEISDRAGIPQSRISAILSTKTINEPSFIKLLQGGIVNVFEIMESLDLEQEKEFIKTFAVYEGGEREE